MEANQQAARDIRTMTKIIQRIETVIAGYDAVYCDLWGCLHNGKRAYDSAVAALRAFRATGGTVVLLTNSPRPSHGIVTQLERFHVPTDCYDFIVSSGDAAQNGLTSGTFGRDVYHIGPERDFVFFADSEGKPFDINRVPLQAAEGIVCTGLFDDHAETPEDYRHTILTGVNRGLEMLCANPDVIVDLGEKRIYCGGAIAEAYRAAGGQVHYYGKPHPPIYAAARQRLVEHLGRDVDTSRILAIGDGIATDVPGAINENIDCLFITGGLAAEETGTTPDAGPEPDLLDGFLTRHQLSPRYAAGYLA